MMNTESPEQATSSAERSLAVRQAQQLLTGDRGLRLTNYEEMYRFAKAVAQSKFKPVPDWTEVDCFICLQKGAEVGMTPMQSLESIYIVNNRATLFGDAPKGLIEASGLMVDYDQYEEGKPFEDDYKYVVTSHRKGRSKPLTTTYSVADAKLAKLWGKAGSWTTAPKRMLMFRARGFNLRDNFADILKGFTIGELLDEESVAGFENAKTASAKIVEPNFDKEPTVPDQPGAPPIAAEIETPRRSPGRPRKHPLPETPKPEESEPQKQEQPEAAPQPQTPTPTAPGDRQASFFSEQESTPDRPVKEILKRLREIRASEDKFLMLMREYGFVDCEPGEITMGTFTIGNMAEKDLQLAMLNWNQIEQRLTEQK